MKKVCSVVGARPQFIKLAVVSRVLRKHYHEVLIHTGQHYDHNMSDVFFEEMDIPKPDYNLGISGATHGQMTGQMLIEIEKVFLKEQPDLVLDFVVWPETMRDGCNILAKPEKEDILSKLNRNVVFDPAYQPFGDGHSAEHIVAKVKEYLK